MYHDTRRPNRRLIQFSRTGVGLKEECLVEYWERNACPLSSILLYFSATINTPGEGKYLTPVKQTAHKNHVTYIIGKVCVEISPTLSYSSSEWRLKEQVGKMYTKKECLLAFRLEQWNDVILFWERVVSFLPPAFREEKWEIMEEKCLLWFRQKKKKSRVIEKLCILIISVDLQVLKVQRLENTEKKKL